MKQVVAKLSALCLSMVAGCAAANCLTDTSQADFQAGTPTNVDLTASPGDVVLAQSGGSSGTVDQQNTSFTTNGELFSNSSNTQWAAQTFTAGRSGLVTQIDVNVFCTFCTTAPPKIAVSIRATSAGAPSGSDLASTTFTLSDHSGTQVWNSAVFATPATITAGTQYAIVLHPVSALTSGGLGFSDSAITGLTGNDVYPGGAIYYTTNAGSSWALETGPKPSVDGAFKVYVASGGTGGYVASGDLVSSLKDSAPPAGSTVTWDALNWTATVGGSTSLKFQVAASNSSGGPFAFVGPDGTAGTFFTTSGASLSLFNGNRYLKYRAFLATGSSSSTPTLSSAQACYTATAASADLSVTVDDGQTTATPGGSVTYNIVAHNAGPSNVASATLADTFPAALTCSWTCAGSGGGTCPAPSGSGSINASVGLPAGASSTFTATCSIDANAGGTLTDTASISSSVSDPATGNNSATDSDTLSASTNVAVTMSDQVSMVRVGDVVDYTINVTNNSAPSNANVSVTDSLSAQLTGGSWVCTAHGGATCGGNQGSGNLSDSPSLPTGSGVTYVYSATVVSGDANGMVGNVVTVKVNGGGNQASANISASDTDVLIIFAAGFEGSGKAMTTAIGGGGASSTIQLGVDAGLMNQAPALPLTVATGLAPSGHRLFSVQLMRFGGAVLMRTLTAIDGSAFSDVSSWQALRPGQPLNLQWHAATRRGDDGYLRAGSLPTSAHNEREPLTQLSIAVEQTVPWVVPVEP